LATRKLLMMGAAIYQDLHALKLGIYVIHLNYLHAGLIETLRHYTVSALMVSSTPGRVQDKDMMQAIHKTCKLQCTVA